MKIQHVSDVHCEFHADKGVHFCKNLPVEADILILPGDFATHNELIQALSILSERFKHVIHVSGNHEYYGTNRGNIHNKLKKVAKRFDNFHPLNDNMVVIEGVRFVGSTLWWSAPPDKMFRISQGLNDFTAIKGYRKWVGEANSKAKAFLKDVIEEGDVVVTHHAPSWESRVRHDGRYGNNDLDYAYYNALDDLILDKKAKLWIHGHTHDPVNYMIGSTRIVSAPHGYTRRGLYGMLDKHRVEEV